MSLFIENISLQFSFLYVFMQDGHQDNPDLTKGVWKHSLSSILGEDFGKYGHLLLKCMVEFSHKDTYMVWAFTCWEVSEDWLAGERLVQHL